MHYSVDASRQYHIEVSENEIGKYVILPGDPKRVPKIAKYLEDAKEVADAREFVTYTGTLSGEKVSVTSTGIGGPSAAIALEELVKAGAHTFIRVGTCGGMQMDVKSGDLVIATAAIRMEGTSREYAPIEFPAVASLDVVNALVSSASEGDTPFHTGVLQSKDAFYGQASEMETAALFTVSAARGVRCGSCYLVMANQEREKAGLSNPVVHDTDHAIRVAVSAMQKLIQEDNKPSF